MSNTDTPTTTRREWIEIAIATAAVTAAYFIAPALGINLPPEAMAFASVGAAYLYGDGATDLVRKRRQSQTTDSER